MSNRDLLVVAGLASEVLERHGLVACGRKQNGVARVDFWARDGRAWQLELNDDTQSTEDVVAACLALAGIDPGPTRGQC